MMPNIFVLTLTESGSCNELTIAWSELNLGTVQIFINFLIQSEYASPSFRPSFTMKPHRQPHIFSTVHAMALVSLTWSGFEWGTKTGLWRSICLVKGKEGWSQKRKARCQGHRLSRKLAIGVRKTNIYVWNALLSVGFTKRTRVAYRSFEVPFWE